MNGDNSNAYLTDAATGTVGEVVVSRDNLERTTSLFFSYSTPTSDPDVQIVTQGAGRIPNSAYTTTTTSARLLLPSTPFVVQRCIANTTTNESSCTPGPTVAWDLTWVRNGYSEIERFGIERVKVGPVVTRYTGWLHERSALVNGTYNDNVASDNNGFLRDTMSMSVTVEVTLTLR